MKMRLVFALAVLNAFAIAAEAQEVLVGRVELYRHREPITTLAKIPPRVAAPILVAAGVNTQVANVFPTKLLSILDSTSSGWKPRYESPQGYTICTAKVSSGEPGSDSIPVESHAAIITARIYRNYRPGTADARDGLYFSADVPHDGRAHAIMDVVFVPLDEVNSYKCAPDGQTLFFESMYDKTTISWPRDSQRVQQ